MPLPVAEREANGGKTLLHKGTERLESHHFSGYRKSGINGGAELKKSKLAVFVGSTHDDIRGFPEEVRRAFGYAIWQAQLGDRVSYAKAMKGQLRDVIEIVTDDSRGERTYRAMYTVKLGDAVYVLHAFQKKAKRGIGTSKAELELIELRLRIARIKHENRVH